MHGRGVDEQRLQLDRRKLVGHDAIRRVSPQPRRLEHVGFVDRAQLATPAGGQLRGDADDAFDFRRVVRAKVAGGRRFTRFLAEVNAARQLPDDDQIDTFEDFRFERRRSDELVDDFDRPQVGEDAERRA